MEFVELDDIRKLALKIINSETDVILITSIDYVDAVKIKNIKLDKNDQNTFNNIFENAVGQAVLIAAIDLTLTENEIWSGDTSKEKMSEFIEVANDLTRKYKFYKDTFEDISNMQNSSNK